MMPGGYLKDQGPTLPAVIIDLGVLWPHENRCVRWIDTVPCEAYEQIHGILETVGNLTSKIWDLRYITHYWSFPFHINNRFVQWPVLRGFTSKTLHDLFRSSQMTSVQHSSFGYLKNHWFLASHFYRSTIFAQSISSRRSVSSALGSPKEKSSARLHSPNRRCNRCWCEADTDGDGCT